MTENNNDALLIVIMQCPLSVLHLKASTGFIQTEDILFAFHPIKGHCERSRWVAIDSQK